MYIWLLFLSIILLCIMSSTTSIEKYEEKKNIDNKWSKDVYVVRPPYNISNYYNPDNVAPVKILKYNFLNNWIVG